MLSIDELLVADAPAPWRAAGFEVDTDDVCRVGSVRIRLLGAEAGKGVVGWTLRGLPDGLDGIDGVSSSASTAPACVGARHPNGVTHIDHVVLLTPDLARTVAALRAVGLEPRRERDGALGGTPMRQVFYRLDEVILEVVGPADAADTADTGPARLWGLTHTVADIDATAELLGDHLGAVKEAVQPGRRITTMRTRELGISVRTALISPHVRR